jgi:DNA-binding response OmpR family regulator
MQSNTNTILLIEDDLFIGEMYSRSLTKEGYAVKLIANGGEGLKEALAKHYDLILLDVILPDKAGTEILQALRGKEDRVPDSRIIVLTNYEQDEESKLAMQSKADGYLIKADITPSKLLEIIRSFDK